MSHVARGQLMSHVARETQDEISNLEQFLATDPELERQILDSMLKEERSSSQLLDLVRETEERADRKRIEGERGTSQSRPQQEQELFLSELNDLNGLLSRPSALEASSLRTEERPRVDRETLRRDLSEIDRELKEAEELLDG